MLTRKQFLRSSVVAAAGLSFLGCGEAEPRETTTTMTDEDNSQTPGPLPYLESIGLQLWSVRDQVELDPRETFKTLADIGYRQVELMDTRQAAELVPLAEEYGMQVNSSFINWNTVTGGWRYTPDDTPFEFTEVIDQAGERGISHLVFGYLRPEERTSTDDWKRLADQLHAAGDQAKAAGLKMAYHNHNFEWDPIEDTTGWALLNERMDGDLVPFELDVFWAEIAGQDARATMKGISDRLSLLHLKQLNPVVKKVTRLDEVDPTSFEELPDGDIPIKELMRYGKELGVTYCMVEQDDNYEGSSLASVEKSFNFLKG